MASHVYLYDVGRHGDKIVQEVSLPKDFLDRANRYKNETVRLRSLCAYSLLIRKLIENGIEIEPLVTNENNKPDFVNSHFNVSHSGDIVAVMISDKKCGVDIQLAEEARDYEMVAKRVLSENLYKEYENAEDRASYFAKAWAMLEASLKERGCGIVTNDLVLKDIDHPFKEIYDNKSRKYYLSYSPDTEVEIHPFEEI